SVAEEACPMNLAPTSSTTAALAMGDALAMALLELRGLRPEDYAALHPRGTLGWRALFRVADLMHGDDTLPLVREEASIKDAVEEMTRKRPRTAAAGAALHACGMTTVVDGDGRLVGVITDGDLRRLQLADGPTSDARAGEVATHGPKTIGPDDLAAKALEVMEAWAITSLVARDGGGWRLRAEQALMYDQEGRTNLRNLTVRVFQKDRSWTILGDEGDLDQKTKNVEVRKNVVITSRDGLRMDTNVIHWDADAQRL